LLKLYQRSSPNWKDFHGTYDQMVTDFNREGRIESALGYYWQLKDKKERDDFLKNTNAAGIMTRPIWQLMNRLEMFKSCQSDDLTNAYWLEERVVNIPSGVRL